jgi:hypothetical protein
MSWAERRGKSKGLGKYTRKQGRMEGNKLVRLVDDALIK